MSDIEKRLLTAALKKGATWGTEIDVNAAGRGILALNPGVPKLSLAPIPDDSSASAFEHLIDYGDIGPSDFALDFDLRYNHAPLLELIAGFFGTAPAPVQQAATTAYLHTLTLANTAYANFFTYAVEKLSKIHVVPSSIVTKLVFSVSGGLVKIQISVRGDQVKDDSAVVTTLATVTIDDSTNRALKRQGVFRMNAQGGAALASPTDVIAFKDFTLECERKYDAEHDFGGRTIIQCRETGKPEFQLTLNANRMSTANAAYFSEWRAETEKKADLIFTGGLIADTYYHYFKFQLPRLKIEDVEYPDANIIPAKIVLRGLEASAAPTGMTGITKPVQLDLMNKITTSLLA